jgi:ribosome-associated protein
MTAPLDPARRPPRPQANRAETRPEHAVDKPSKTRRKADMHALQDLGVALVELEPRRFDELAGDLALPERLGEAIREARTITAWGGRKRALQYVGKLMRDVDPGPIRRRLERWAHGHTIDVARQRSLETWRERLLAEPVSLDALAAEHPRLDRARLRSLIARALEERARGTPPHAYRELFRALKALETPPTAPPATP